MSQWRMSSLTHLLWGRASRGEQPPFWGPWRFLKSGCMHPPPTHNMWTDRQAVSGARGASIRMRRERDFFTSEIRCQIRGDVYCVFRGQPGWGGSEIEVKWDEVASGPTDGSDNGSSVSADSWQSEKWWHTNERRYGTGDIGQQRTTRPHQCQPGTEGYCPWRLYSNGTLLSVLQPGSGAIGFLGSNGIGQLHCFVAGWMRSILPLSVPHHLRPFSPPSLLSSPLASLCPAQGPESGDIRCGGH